MVESRPERIKILAFEGPDKSGKSTLIREVNKATDYKFLCIDRFTGSAWVYDRLTERRDRTEELSRAEEELSNLDNVLVLTILLNCDPEKLKERITGGLTNDDLATEHLEEAIKLYKEYSESIARLPVIIIDTSNRTVDETVQEIIERVAKYEQDNSR
ncbi:MAG: hypothetical protein ACOYT7_00360 [Patescibacteria group bacterium]